MLTFNTLDITIVLLLKANLKKMESTDGQGLTMGHNDDGCDTQSVGHTSTAKLHPGKSALKNTLLKE